jgi:spermidine/putrescine transport system permease protein
VTPQWASILGKIYLAVIYAFLFFPALLVVVFSFNASRFWAFPLRGFTTRWYEEAFARYEAIEAIWNSVTVACLTTIVAMILGTAAAVGLHQLRSRARGVLEGVILLPQLIPSLIWSIAILAFLSILGLPTSAGTVTLGHVLLTCPFVFLLISTRLMNMNPNLEDAARSLGAGWQYYARRVLFPHLVPAICSSALITFAISFSDLIVAFFLTGGGFNTLPVYMYSLIQFEPSPMINSIASMVFGVGVGLALIAFAIGGRDAILPGRQEVRNG